MKVKLEHLEVFMTLDKNRCQVVNARKQIANIIYSQGAGLGAGRTGSCCEDVERK